MVRSRRAEISCIAVSAASALALAPSRSFPRLRQLPKLRLLDDGDPVPQRREAPDLHQLGPGVFPGDLQRVRTAADEHVGRPSRLRLDDRAGLAGRGDRLAARTL